MIKWNNISVVLQKIHHDERTLLLYLNIKKINGYTIKNRKRYTPNSVSNILRQDYASYVS